MQKNTSITLGQHFDAFIAEQLKNGRYSSTSEVVRAALRLLEESETRLTTLRKLLKEGEDSGFEDYSYDSFIRELDNEGRWCQVSSFPGRPKLTSNPLHYTRSANGVGINETTIFFSSINASTCWVKIQTWDKPAMR